jgi:pimeloyl-ACP methyl ester carboxylesterase
MGVSHGRAMAKIAVLQFQAVAQDPRQTWPRLVNARISTTLLSLCLLCGCSFDDTFFPVDERPDSSTDAGQENIVLKAADGKNIHHYLIKPQSNPKATIFVFQGSGSKVANWRPLLEPLLQDGYQLFLMEYRGFGDSEGEAGHETVAADAHRAFSYLIDREDVKGKPLLLLGQSYGGQLAIKVAASFPHEADALVTEGTFTTFRSIAVYSTPWIGRPFTWIFFRNPYRSLELIQAVAIPTLIIHSREDDVVPFFMGEQLFGHAGGDKEFWKIRGEHTDALIDYPHQFIVKMNRLTERAHHR